MKCLLLLLAIVASDVSASQMFSFTANQSPVITDGHIGDVNCGVRQSSVQFVMLYSGRVIGVVDCDSLWNKTCLLMCQTELPVMECSNSADFNHDGVVNAADLVIFKQSFMKK